jgi:hypothetical protein
MRLSEDGRFPEGGVSWDPFPDIKAADNPGKLFQNILRKITCFGQSG